MILTFLIYNAKFKNWINIPGR